MARNIYLGFGSVAYAIFLLTFLYLVAFVGDFGLVPNTVDRGGVTSPGALAAFNNLILVLLFAVQHSVMARPWFKSWWTRLVPQPIERSTYVLFASMALILMFAVWSPIAVPIWSVEAQLGRIILWALFAAGWGIVLLSTFLISHFELFGLKQVWMHLRGRMAATPVLRQPFLYRFVRHPLYSGFFLAFWSTPHMTVGHLLLAAGMSAFMLIAIRFEERDLVDTFGDEYREYRRTTGMLAPGIGRSRA